MSKFFWGFFLISLIQYGYALESSDIMDTQILKAYNKNILVLNRGLEDAIYRNDHIKLTNDNGFIARGICIKVTMLASHWKIYRVVRPELVSKDTIYQMRSINQSLTPQDIAKLKQVDFSQYFSYGDKERLKELKLQNKRVANYDLPKRIQDTALYERATKSRFDQFIEDNVIDVDLKKDISETYFEIFASPYTWETLYDQRESHYGARLYNKGSKLQYELNALERQRRIVNPLNRFESFNSKATHYDLTLQLNRVAKNWSMISWINYDREKFGRIYYPFKYYYGGILGLKYHVWEQDAKRNFFEISYLPIFDTIEYDDPTNPETDLTERTGYRHQFLARLYSDISEKLHLKFDLRYAPFTFDIIGVDDWGDNMMNLNLTFSYDLGNSFFADYSLQYMKDELRANVYSIREDNTINTIRLRYEFDL